MRITSSGASRPRDEGRLACAAAGLGDLKKARQTGRLQRANSIQSAMCSWSSGSRRRVRCQWSVRRVGPKGQQPQTTGSSFRWAVCEFVRIKSLALASARSCPPSVCRIRVSSHQHS